MPLSHQRIVVAEGERVQIYLLSKWFGNCL